MNMFEKNETSKSGIKLVALALMGYIFCYFGYYQYILLLLGFVIIVEKNNWIIYQLSQALVLRMSYDVIGSIWGFLYQRIYNVLNFFELSYDTMKSFSNFNKTLADIMLFAFLTLLFIGIIKLLTNRNARIPFISNLTDKTVDFN